jgi:hypothetical protein
MKNAKKDCLNELFLQQHFRGFEVAKTGFFAKFIY